MNHEIESSPAPAPDHHPLQHRYDPRWINVHLALTPQQFLAGMLAANGCAAGLRGGYAARARTTSASGPEHVCGIRVML